MYVWYINNQPINEITEEEKEYKNDKRGIWKCVNDRIVETSIVVNIFMERKNLDDDDDATNYYFNDKRK